MQVSSKSQNPSRHVQTNWPRMQVTPIGRHHPASQVMHVKLLLNPQLTQSALLVQPGQTSCPPQPSGPIEVTRGGQVFGVQSQAPVVSLQKLFGNSVQDPQEPPQPSSPQVLPVQSGGQVVDVAGGAVVGVWVVVVVVPPGGSQMLALQR